MGLVSRSPQSTVWLLTVDGKQMRVYECRWVKPTTQINETGKHVQFSGQPSWQLSPLPCLFRTAETHENYQTAYNRHRPIFMRSVSTPYQLEPRVDSHEEIKRDFMSTIAMTLRQAYLRKNFDRLILTAPPKFLLELREYLGPDIMKWVIAEFPKELTDYKKDELFEHIKHALPFIQAA